MTSRPPRLGKGKQNIEGKRDYELSFFILEAISYTVVFRHICYHALTCG